MENINTKGSKNMVHASVEIESNDRYVWYVCDECQGEVKPFDEKCSHCQAVLDWEKIFLWYRPDGKGDVKNG